VNGIEATSHCIGHPRVLTSSGKTESRKVNGYVRFILGDFAVCHTNSSMVWGLSVG
jgi:hypothetical protein